VTAGFAVPGAQTLLTVRGGPPAQGRSELSGHVGQDLDVVLALEAERQREGDLPDLSAKATSRTSRKPACA